MLTVLIIFLCVLFWLVFLGLRYQMFMVDLSVRCRKQVKCLGKYFTFSFFFSAFKWFFSGIGDSCGFDSFPSLGLKAFHNKYATFLFLSLLIRVLRSISYTFYSSYCQSLKQVTLSYNFSLATYLALETMGYFCQAAGEMNVMKRILWLMVFLLCCCCGFMSAGCTSTSAWPT